MLKIRILFISLLISVSVSAQWIIEDNEVELRNVDASFDKIEVDGVIQLYLTQNNETQLAVSGISKGSLASVKTNVRNGTLHISGGMDGKGKPKVFVAFKDLSELSVSGKVIVQVTTDWITPVVEIDFSGVVKFSGKVKFQEAEISLSGVAKAIFDGDIKKLELECSGTSMFTGPDLIVDYADLEASGTAMIEIAQIKRMKAEASGASSILYHNNPEIIKREISGVSKIQKGISSKE